MKSTEVIQMIKLTTLNKIVKLFKGPSRMYMLYEDYDRELEISMLIDVMLEDIKEQKLKEKKRLEHKEKKNAVN